MFPVVLWELSTAVTEGFFTALCLCDAHMLLSRRKVQSDSQYYLENGIKYCLKVRKLNQHSIFIQLVFLSSKTTLLSFSQ